MYCKPEKQLGHYDVIKTSLSVFHIIKSLLHHQILVVLYVLLFYLIPLHIRVHGTRFNVGGPKIA